MHIIIALLGSIVTILILLNRLADAGIDLGWLNPYLWRRRRNWKDKYEGDPIFRINSPMDATAILMVAAAKSDGDFTKDDKNLLLSLFESEFKLSKKDAAGLLISSGHLLGDGASVRGDVRKFLAPSKASFTESQVESAIDLLSRIVKNRENAHPNAEEFFDQVRSVLCEGPA